MKRGKCEKKRQDGKRKVEKAAMEEEGGVIMKEEMRKRKAR